MKYRFGRNGHSNFRPSPFSMSSKRCAAAPIAQTMIAGIIFTASFGYFRPAIQNAAATQLMIMAVPTKECVAVRCQCRNDLAPPNRVTQSTSATKPETRSIGVAIRVILLSPARPSAIEVSAWVTGSMEA